MRKSGRLTFLVILLLCYSTSGWSLGLGDARVQSFIGQPLEMHIDLLTAPNDDLESVIARLATAEDFALIGASRESISVPLQFMVQEEGGDSGSYILVTSRLAVNDPVLRLVVEVNWSSGRLLREYTVFLDPPTVAAQAPDPVISPPPRSQTQSVSEPEPQVQEETPVFTDRPPAPPAVGEQAEDVVVDSGASSAAEQQAEQQVAADVSEDSVAEEVEAQATVAEAETPDEEPAATGTVSEGVYGPVQNGETLWRIASNYMGTSQMDMNQVMVAIQRKNPSAFVNDNINLLKRGAVLDLPSRDEVNELSRAEARAMVAQHEAAFRMRSSLASTSTPLLASESQSRSESQSETQPEEQSGQIESASGAAAEDSAEENFALLEIVPASEDSATGAEPGTGAVPGGEGSDEISRDVREELARTEEALISVQQENTYLQERIAELESQIADTAGESEGSVADEELADLEERLEAERLSRQQELAAEEEADNRVPSVTSLSDQEDTPWYSGRMTWIIMIVILVAAIIGWLFNRRRSAVEYDLDAESTTVATGLKGEAEEILRTLDADSDADTVIQKIPENDADESGNETANDKGTDSDETESVPDSDGKQDADESEAEVVPLARARRRIQDDGGDATVLDEDSSDPEIKLDLARAYISMGDKEAARAILEEVLNLGNEQQQSEARSMMDEI
ncbi:MAG TPA: FimV/HubP family polar landmark protein [Xanthomonadales bacterium]|nr:FimV/HubP family polar landmark protein [Xanthomonadales bacterium]